MGCQVCLQCRLLHVLDALHVQRKKITVEPTLRSTSRASGALLAHEPPLPAASLALGVQDAMRV